MKVIFLEDVPRVAKAGQIKEVADGYGRNYLIPQKLAVMASASAVNIMEAQRKLRAKEEAKMETELQELARQLEGKEVVLKAKAGAKEKLYGSITSHDIAVGLEAIGLIIDKKKIELDEPIRQLGSYDVALRLAKDIVPSVKVIVVGEEAEKEVKETEETKGIDETKGAEEAHKTGEPELTEEVKEEAA